MDQDRVLDGVDRPDRAGRAFYPGVNGGILRRQHAGQAPVNYISVESVDQHVKKATRLGAEEVMAKTPVPGMGWFAWLKDTEGNVVGIWESDEKAS